VDGESLRALGKLGLKVRHGLGGWMD